MTQAIPRTHCLVVRRETEETGASLILQYPYGAFGSLFDLADAFTHGKPFHLFGPAAVDPDPYQ